MTTTVNKKPNAAVIRKCKIALFPLLLAITAETAHTSKKKINPQIGSIPTP